MERLEPNQQGKGKEMKPYTVEQTIDGDYMVLVDGLQWGPGPRDLSGAACATWSTKKRAINAIEKGECYPVKIGDYNISCQEEYDLIAKPRT
jgi:hypothetical protein